MADSLDFDIVVVGGGPVGLTAALLLARNRYRVALAAPVAGNDGRSVALLQSSLEILAATGCRDAIQEAGAPLTIMRLVDDTKRLFHAPEISFRASELGFPAFGYSIPTARLIDILRRQAGQAQNLTLLDTEITGLKPGEDRVALTTKTEDTLTAILAVGADGIRSICRDAADLPLKSWSYRQKALVTTFAHTRPHDNISTEFHTRAGPFTVVPIADKRCGLVWVDRPDVIERWGIADPGDLSGEIARRSHFILGDVTVEEPARTFPMGSGQVSPPAAARIALIGEAAHFFPPIGAQGLNLGLRDCAALARAIGRGNPDPGAAATLQRYVSARKLDVSSRTHGVDLLNRSLLIDFLPAQAARALALTLAGTITPLRRMMMRLGMAIPP